MWSGYRNQPNDPTRNGARIWIREREVTSIIGASGENAQNIAVGEDGGCS